MTKPPKPPTLVQVARMAGVGIGTASRVLNRDGYVSTKTAARVMEVIEQLGYKPNEVARSLKARRSGAIGIIVPDLGDPFVSMSVHAAQGVLRSHNYFSVLTTSNGIAETEAKEVEYLLRRQVDGLLVIPCGLEGDHFQPSVLNGTPAVSFDQPVSGYPLDSVLVKNSAGASAAVEHLIEHKHSRIVCLGVNAHLYTIKKRIEGYRRTMGKAGLKEDVCIVDATEEAVGATVDEWLSRRSPPTAIFSLNGLTTLCLLRVLAERKVAIPTQMAVIAFDDLQLADLLNPPLTVVRQPASELGARAASLLFDRMGKSAGGPPARLALQTELIIRQSCGCTGTPRAVPPVED